MTTIGDNVSAFASGAPLPSRAVSSTKILIIPHKIPMAGDGRKTKVERAADENVAGYGHYYSREATGFSWGKKASQFRA